MSWIALALIPSGYSYESRDRATLKLGLQGADLEWAHGTGMHIHPRVSHQLVGHVCYQVWVCELDAGVDHTHLDPASTMESTHSTIIECWRFVLSFILLVRCTLLDEDQDLERVPAVAATSERFARELLDAIHSRLAASANVPGLGRADLFHGNG